MPPTHIRWDVVNFIIFVKPIEKLAELCVDLTLACQTTEAQSEPRTISGPPFCSVDSVGLPQGAWQKSFAAHKEV